MFKTSRLTIRVDDLQSAVDFYVKKLGFAETEHPIGGSAAVQGPGVSILFMQRLAGQPRPTGNQVAALGLFVDDLGAAMETLAARGIDFEGEPVELAAIRIAFFSDPDGTQLYLAELSEG